MNYTIITAAKNEEKYISKTLESVTNQQILPVEWVIVNDGSTDTTAEIIKEYASRFPWIIQIDLNNYKPELKSTGGRVASLLNIAAKRITKQYDIITKLDADTEFDNTFFSNLLAQFNKNNKLGVASGTLVYEGKIEKIDYNSSVTRGAVMLIKNEVFKQTNGFFEANGNGEDSLLTLAARYFGWETKSYPIYFNHLKPEGIKNSSFFSAYITGFHKGSIPYRFDFFLLTQIKHIIKKPYLIGTLLQIWGYLYSRIILRYRPYPKYVKIQKHKEQKEQIKIIKS